MRAGGQLEFSEAEWVLRSVHTKMPFPVRFVSQEMLDTESAIEAYVAAHNVNPIPFDLAARLTLAIMHRFASDYDFFWLGKYR